MTPEFVGEVLRVPNLTFCTQILCPDAPLRNDQAIASMAIAETQVLPTTLSS